MRKIAIITGVTFLALVAGPGVARDKDTAWMAATPDGKPVSCIPLRSIRETRVRNDKVIDFLTNDGKVYRNTLPYGCPQLGFEESFSYKTSLSQLCSNDIITVLLGGGPGLATGASCGLSEFQPVSLPPK